MTVPELRSLVLGGAGFLGSHLCDRLLREGQRVICLDDLSTGSRANVRHLDGEARFTFVEQCVMGPLDRVTGEVDWVWNLACPASPPHYQRDPVRTTLVNVLGTLHGLRLATSRGARFFQASTSEVYGDPEVHPQPETYRGAVNTLGIRSCYDEGKRCAESIVMDMQRTTGVEVRMARIFNTYGPRMATDDGRVVSNFLVQALRGEDLTIYGDGSQTRSFCFVDDLLDGFLALMRHPHEPGPVNLGNPREFTMNELAREVLRLTGSDSRVVHHPLPEDDPKLRCPDITKARALLGFEPRVRLAEGLARTMSYFRDVLAREERHVPRWHGSAVAGEAVPGAVAAD